MNYKNSQHKSIKLTSIEDSWKINEKVVFSNLKDNREIQKRNFKFGDLVRAADNKKVFSEGDSTNWSYQLFTNSEILHDIIPSYRIDYKPEIYIENILRTAKLYLDENTKILKELNLFIFIKLNKWLCWRIKL